MNPTLPEEAVDLGAAARKAFESLGGVDLFRRAEADPAVRAGEVGPALAALGLDDIDPRADAVSLAAAAALCEAAGRVALPHPVAGALVRDADGRPTAVVPTTRARVDHGDLFATWSVGSLAGAGAGGTATPGAPLDTRLGRFVTDLTVAAGPAGPAVPAADVDLVLALAAWSVLGTVDRAVELAVDHVTGRVQFGKPLSAFQAVQFQLADAAVAVAGLRELAGFTLWRLVAAPDEARTDVLALRVHALDVAKAVLRTCQQLHGAAGVCDEYDISVLVRAVQPALRLPESGEATVARLADAVAATGFVGLFPHGGAAR